MLVGAPQTARRAGLLAQLVCDWTFDWIVDDAEGQVVQVVTNLNALLAHQGLGAAHIVRMTVYLTDSALLPLWQKHRPALIGEYAPASTLVYVAGLADERLKIEVEMEAAG